MLFRRLMSLGTITIITSRLELRRKQRHCHLICPSRGVSGLSFPKPHDPPEKREERGSGPTVRSGCGGCGAQCSTVRVVPSPVLRSTTSSICVSSERVHRTVPAIIPLFLPSSFSSFFASRPTLTPVSHLFKLHTPRIDIIGAIRIEGSKIRILEYVSARPREPASGSVLTC
jgi:hypothetical protein